MTDLENNFSIYPYDYNELTREHALQESRTFESQHRDQLAQELTIPLSAVALGALTGGIASPEYTAQYPAELSPERRRKLGNTLVSHSVTIEDSSPAYLLKIDQLATTDVRLALENAA